MFAQPRHHLQIKRHGVIHEAFVDMHMVDGEKEGNRLRTFKARRFFPAFRKKLQKEKQMSLKACGASAQSVVPFCIALNSKKR